MAGHAPPAGRKAGAGCGLTQRVGRPQEPDKGTARQLSRESDSQPFVPPPFYGFYLFKGRVG
jgi:hypothetical protein